MKSENGPNPITVLARILSMYVVSSFNPVILRLSRGKGTVILLIAVSLSTPKYSMKKLVNTPF